MRRVVNSVNVRRFLSPMRGIRRECLESPSALKVNPRRKRPVVHTLCKFVAECSDVDPTFELISRSCVPVLAIHRRKNGKKEREKGSTRTFNIQRESLVSPIPEPSYQLRTGGSNDWPKIPTIELKSCRTFTLFTGGRRSGPRKYS